MRTAVVAVIGLLISLLDDIVGACVTSRFLPDDCSPTVRWGISATFAVITMAAFGWWWRRRKKGGNDKARRLRETVALAAETTALVAVWAVWLAFKGAEALAQKLDDLI